MAFFEYLVQVPANRWGSALYSTTQLKTLQEVIGLAGFVLFPVFYLKQPFHWNYLAGFVLIALGAFLILHRWCPTKGLPFFPPATIAQQGFKLFKSLNPCNALLGHLAKVESICGT